MNVVDSSGWLEYFADGQNSDFFVAVIWTQESDFQNIEDVRWFFGIRMVLR